VSATLGGSTVRPESAPREGRPVSVGALWAGVLTPPLAALVLLEVAYLLVPYGCRTGREWPLHVSALAAVLIAAAGSALAWRNWEAVGRTWPDTEGGATPRSRYLAAFGVLSGLLFALVIVAEWVPMLILEPCQRP